ncbi:DUF2290 domain-containing protein [Antarcticibacterium sp. 1MA-6-2]|uniref:DUF2290 domain-containing protein n=1 Tax=Antarcticibacterium sp. 1MA-6-2 TaxID=2908210 RepID=UPI001F18906E|nr:DUF2290 domain-containing protein [Antarcticibacterium sp. 1MA-6-2]UJH92077.1 DUF2290 domain-containing protein [Antarcticibacterium sp. 1MA-6-2]
MSFAKGKFEAELNDIEKLLRNIDFFEERNFYPSNDFDPSVYRKKNYLENWKSLISDNIYSFMLTDNSILNFKLDIDNRKISYTYYECPFKSLSYKEYLIDNDIDFEEDSKIFIDYYEVYLHQCEQKENPLMIRYDYDENSYFEGVHPASHLHVGHKNQVRLGLNKILTPKSFTSIILRQNYPAYWKTLIISKNTWREAFLKEKSALLDISSSHWKKLDKSEFHLN